MVGPGSWKRDLSQRSNTQDQSRQKWTSKLLGSNKGTKKFRF